jgi:hypothetical protein
MIEINKKTRKPNVSCQSEPSESWCSNLNMMILFILFISLIITPLQTKWVSFSTYKGEEPTVKVISQDNFSTTIEFSLPGYYFSEVSLNGEIYSKIYLPKTPSHLERGYPQLPMISKSIIIPDEARMNYHIIEKKVETLTVDPIIPSKGNLTRDINPSTISYTFDEYYKTNDWYPYKVFSLGNPFILRDYRGISFTFNPFQYNPYRKELRVVKNLVVKIYVDGYGGLNIKRRNSRRISREFKGLYKHLFLNFSTTRWDSIDEHAGRLLIITADEYYDNMVPFYQWKLQKGFPTKLVKYSEVGSGQTAIKNYITDEYNGVGVTFVLLVGDAEDIPPATGTVGSAAGEPADPVYACVEGADYYPDLFISRFSANTAIDVDNQVSRSVYYEQSPDTGADWYRWGSGVGSDTVSLEKLRDSLLTYTYTHIDQLYYPGATPSMVKDSLEKGRSIVNYVGQGSSTGWQNPLFNISDVNNLQNPWKLPFIISVAPLVGQFLGQTCFCEAWLWAGTPSEPRGAISHWGSSIIQTWVPPTYGQAGAANLLTHDRMNTAGGIFFNGACYMMDVYGGGAAGVEIFQTWHIFGDASVQLRTDTPGAMVVNHSSEIYMGATTFNVQVVGVEDALCALFRNDTLYGSAYTNASGFAAIFLDPPVLSVGDFTLTVTAYNKIPYIASVPVIVGPSNVFIVYLKGVIDDSSGNGNGRINPGETIDLTAWATNIGIQTGYSIYALLTETNPYVDISSDSSWFGNIAAGDSAGGTPPYVFSVSDSCPDGHTILFEFTAHDVNDSVWLSHALFIVYAPLLTIYDFVVDPGGDQRLDPGETAHLIVTLKNEGGEDASSVTGYLFEDSPYIDVPDPDGSFGDIPSGGTGNNNSDPFIIHAETYTPYGHTFTVYLEVNSGIYCDTLEFEMLVGRKQYLIWDPDPNHSSGPILDASLQSCGYAGDYSIILPVDNLYDYEVIFVCVGIFPHNYIIGNTSSEAAALVEFVNQGGGLYLEGGDVWFYDPMYGGYDFGPLFGINATEDGWDDLATIQGESGTFTQDMSFSYAGENNWIDHISPTGGDAFLIFKNSSPVYDCGVANEGGIYRTVGLSFEFGGLTDGSPPSTKDTLAYNLIRFLWIIWTKKEQANLLNLPKIYSLSQNCPNPCCNRTVIDYQIPRKSEVSLRVYDVSGRLIDVLIDGEVEPGYYSSRLDTKGYTNGIYFYRLIAGSKNFTKKLIVVK